MAPGKKTGGRVKGVPNKVSRSVKESYLDAFQRLGGSDGLVAWAKQSPQNLTDFHKLASKLIPTEVSGADGGPVIVEVVRLAVNDENPPINREP